MKTLGIALTLLLVSTASVNAENSKPSDLLNESLPKRMDLILQCDEWSATRQPDVAGALTCGLIRESILLTMAIEHCGVSSEKDDLSRETQKVRNCAYREYRDYKVKYRTF